MPNPIWFLIFFADNNYGYKDRKGRSWKKAVYRLQQADYLENWGWRVAAVLKRCRAASAHRDRKNVVNR